MSLRIYMNPTVLKPHNEGVILSIRVNPKASKSGINGLIGDELKINLNAPPTDGQANKELIKLLSKTFSIPKSQVKIISGETSRSKKILLINADEQTIQTHINQFLSE